MNFKQIIWCLCTCLISPYIVAQELTGTVEMFITPTVCVVRDRGDVCRMNTEVQWEAPKPIHACLFQNNESIKCWSNVRRVQEKLPLSLIKDMTLSLKNKQAVLAKVIIKVNASTSIKYRRRLRSQWSLF